MTFCPSGDSKLVIVPIAPFNTLSVVHTLCLNMTLAPMTTCLIAQHVISQQLQAELNTCARVVLTRCLLMNL